MKFKCDSKVCFFPRSIFIFLLKQRAFNFLSGPTLSIDHSIKSRRSMPMHQWVPSRPGCWQRCQLRSQSHWTELDISAPDRSQTETSHAALRPSVVLPFASITVHFWSQVIVSKSTASPAAERLVFITSTILLLTCKMSFCKCYHWRYKQLQLFQRCRISINVPV